MKTLKTSFSKKIWFLLGMLGLFLVQDKLQELWEPFQNFDEIFGLAVIPAFLVRLWQKRLKMEKRDI